MLIRSLLVALLIGLGLHHAAPLMPASSHTTHQVECAGGCEDGASGIALGIGIACAAALTVIAGFPGIRRRFLRVSRLSTPSLLHPAGRVSHARALLRGPPPGTSATTGSIVLRC